MREKPNETPPGTRKDRPFVATVLRPWWAALWGVSALTPVGLLVVACLAWGDVDVPAWLFLSGFLGSYLLGAVGVLVAMWVSPRSALERWCLLAFTLVVFFPASFLGLWIALVITFGPIQS